jgi:hypothetical protein
MPGWTDQPNGGDQCNVMGLGAEVGGNELRCRAEGEAAKKVSKPVKLLTSQRPYKIGGGSRGEGEPRVLRVYLRRICNIVFPTQSVLIRI